ncbi:hypothetical protein ACHAXM_000087 [Skeletonema potamos]
MSSQRSAVSEDEACSSEDEETRRYMEKLEAQDKAKLAASEKRSAKRVARATQIRAEITGEESDDISDSDDDDDEAVTAVVVGNSGDDEGGEYDRYEHDQRFMDELWTIPPLPKSKRRSNYGRKELDEEEEEERREEEEEEEDDEEEEDFMNSIPYGNIIRQRNECRD